MMGQILFFGLFLQSDTRDSRLPLRRFKSFNLSSIISSLCSARDWTSSQLLALKTNSDDISANVKPKY